MAKFGEGDKRWIVNDMGKAGRNVNSWHWEEKNCTVFAHNYLKENLSGTKLSEQYDLKVDSVEKISGDDITYCRRKGKNFFFFDINVELKWSGKKDDNEYTGTIKYTDWDQDCKLDEIDYRISCKKAGANANELKAIIKKDGLPVLVEKFRAFMAALGEQYIQVSNPDLSRSSNANKKAENFTKTVITTTTTTSSSSSPSCKTHNTVVQFRGPIQEVFECFCDWQRLSVFSQSKAEMQKKEGTTFALFSGSITGTVEKFDQNKLLKLKWRFADWKDGHFSTVTLSFKPISSGTELTLEHKDIPNDDFDRTVAGWRANFWERIRMVFGFNFKVTK